MLDMVLFSHVWFTMCMSGVVCLILFFQFSNAFQSSIRGYGNWSHTRTTNNTIKKNTAEKQKRTANENFKAEKTHSHVLVVATTAVCI